MQHAISKQGQSYRWLKSHVFNTKNINPQSTPAHISTILEVFYSSLNNILTIFTFLSLVVNLSILCICKDYYKQNQFWIRRVPRVYSAPTWHLTIETRCTWVQARAWASIKKSTSLMKIIAWQSASSPSETVKTSYPACSSAQPTMFSTAEREAVWIVIRLVLLSQEQV